MAFYVVTGQPDCTDFVQVVYVCSYLSQHLPDFKYKKLEIPKGEWEFFLHEQNNKNNWYHTKSPLIWKEVARRGGKAFLIGGISEFWEYVYDFYGLEAALPKEDLELLIQDNMAFYQTRLEKEAAIPEKITKVCVGGIKNPIADLIIPALLTIPNIRSPHGLLLRLYDTNLDLSKDYAYTIDLMDAAMDMTDKVEVVSTLQEALNDCDLFVDIDQDYARKIKEPMELWLVRNMSLMSSFGDAINQHAKRNLKIVLAHPGPCCFNASLLVDYCTAIRPSNIIAITADKGALPLSIISRECEIPLDQLGAPPVWGLWLTPFIDVRSIITKCDIRRPYQRAIRTNGGSTLPLGRITSELHYINYLVDEIEDLWGKAAGTKDTVFQVLGRPLTYAKAMATIKALQIWFSGGACDDIISLGVVSNGCFGFPVGVVVSQPVIFDGRSWVPFRNFPISDDAKKKIDDLVVKLEDLFNKYNFRSTYIASKSKVMI